MIDQLSIRYPHGCFTSRTRFEISVMYYFISTIDSFTVPVIGIMNRCVGGPTLMAYSGCMDILEVFGGLTRGKRAF